MQKKRFVISNDFNGKDVTIIVDGVDFPGNLAIDTKATSDGRLKLFSDQMMRYFIFQMEKGVLKKGFYPDVFFSVYKYSVRSPQKNFKADGRLENVVETLSTNIEYNLTIPLRMLMKLFLLPNYAFNKKGFGEGDVVEIMKGSPVNLNGRYEEFLNVKKNLSQKGLYWYPLSYSPKGRDNDIYGPYVGINSVFMKDLLEFPEKGLSKMFQNSNFSIEKKKLPKNVAVTFKDESYSVKPFPIFLIKDNLPREEFAKQICGSLKRGLFPPSCREGFYLKEEVLSTPDKDELPF